MPQCRQRRAILLVQRTVRFRAQRDQSFGIRQARSRRGQRLVLAGRWCDAVNFLLLIRQQLHPLRAPFAVRLRAVETPHGRPPGAESLCHHGRRRCQLAVGIEQRQVVARIEKRLVRVLAVEVEKALADYLQLADRGQRVVDEGPAAALRRHLPPKKDFVALVGIQRRLDDRLRCARAHQIAAGPPAGQQVQCAEHDRFACTGFPREHGESRLQLQVETLDDGEMSDAEKPNHSCSPKQPAARTPLHSSGDASRLICVVPRSHMPNMLPRHALYWPGAALMPAVLGATRGFATGCLTAS